MRGVVLDARLLSWVHPGMLLCPLTCRPQSARSPEGEGRAWPHATVSPEARTKEPLGDHASWYVCWATQCALREHRDQWG